VTPALASTRGYHEPQAKGCSSGQVAIDHRAKMAAPGSHARLWPCYPPRGHYGGSLTVTEGISAGISLVYFRPPRFDLDRSGHYQLRQPEEAGCGRQSGRASKYRRGGRAVDCTGLENRRPLTRTVGSNPTLSAK